MQLTIVVPVYNEEDVIGPCYERLAAVAAGLPLGTEFLFVDDGSGDGSLALLRELARADERVSYLSLSRNFGKEAAMSAGLDHADGDAVVIIDADLQDPPELIPRMIELWQQGYDNVYAQRQARAGEGLRKRLTARYFYRLMQRLSKVQIPADTGDYRLLSRRAVLALRALPENNRFMKGLFSWIGFAQIAVPYNRQPRHAGDSKFSFWRLWNFALDGITSFSTLPLRLASYLGGLLALVAFCYGGWIVLKTLLFGDPVRGYPTMMTVILLLGGVQLMFFGILGEYVGRMFDETKRRPVYFIDRMHRGGAGDEALAGPPGGSPQGPERQARSERPAPLGP